MGARQDDEGAAGGGRLVGAGGKKARLELAGSLLPVPAEDGEGGYKAGGGGGGHNIYIHVIH